MISRSLPSIGCALALVALALGCGPHTRLEPFERELGTHSQLGFEFHRVVDDPNGLGLRSRGFLLGFEKTKRGKIGCPEPGEVAFEKHIDLSAARGEEPEEVRDHLRERLDDGKCLFLTHVVEYLPASLSNGDSTIQANADPCGPPGKVERKGVVDLASIDHVFHYNLYCEQQRLTDKGAREMTQAAVADELPSKYEASWKQVRDFEKALAEAVEDYKSTHVMLYVMGWSSGQQEALRNVNSIHLSILRAARRRGLKHFNPLPIIVTWPSHWSAELLSYQNKANDADELGAVFLNSLVHRAILPVAERAKIKAVAIAHSFGARATTRALFSDELLRERPVATKRWDLLAALEPAFSIRRFSGDSSEGGPYTEIAKHVGKIVLTWSIHDTANPIAFWSDHAGGRRGSARAEQVGAAQLSAGKPSLFEFAKVTATGKIQPSLLTGPEAIVYLNASELIRYENYAKSGGAHSDIYTSASGEMLMELIDRFAGEKGDAAAPELAP